MENWATFLLVNIVLALVVGMFGNFATGWVQSYYEKRVFSYREKKIDVLKREYRKKKLLSDFPHLLAPFAIRSVAINLIAFIISSAAGVFVFSLLAFLFQNVFGISAWFFYGVFFLLAVGYNAFMLFSETISLIEDAASFSEYKTRAKEKIKKLGGNPEDLDKEETAGG